MDRHPVTMIDTTTMMVATEINTNITNLQEYRRQEAETAHNDPTTHQSIENTTIADLHTTITTNITI